MTDGFVNATRGLEKGPASSDIKNGHSPKGIMLSLYPSIDKKHIRVYVKFDGRLSAPFKKKKWDLKKVNRFPRARPPCFMDGV
jgi:hypothetical protein